MSDGTDQAIEGGFAAGVRKILAQALAIEALRFGRIGAIANGREAQGVGLDPAGMVAALAQQLDVPGIEVETEDRALPDRRLLLAAGAGARYSAMGRRGS